MSAAVLLACLASQGCTSEATYATDSAAMMMIDGAVIELHRRETGRYPAPGYVGPIANIAHLVAAPHRLYHEDGWGAPFLYASSRDGQHYVIVSRGSDSVLDQAVEVPSRLTPSQGLEDPRLDTVFEDGRFVRMQRSFNPDGPDWQKRSKEDLEHSIEQGRRSLEQFRKRWRGFKPLRSWHAP